LQRQLVGTVLGEDHRRDLLAGGMERFPRLPDRGVLFGDGSQLDEHGLLPTTGILSVTSSVSDAYHLRAATHSSSACRHRASCAHLSETSGGR